MKEIWKDIKDYDGLYQVSNTGKIKSLERWIDRKCKGKRWQEEKILKPLVNKHGYLHVGLHKNGKIKNYLVHRLVAEAFIQNPNNYPQVNHKDENPSNNFVNNLEYCDAKYNSNYGTRNERVAEKMKGKHRSEETKIKMSEAHKGKTTWMKGKHLSDEHKRKISKKLTNGKKSKLVLQMDKNTNKVIAEFPSAMEVQRQLGYNQGNISECCNGKRNTAGGYKWRYK